jgi:hypothetical protein
MRSGSIFAYSAAALAALLFAVQCSPQQAPGAPPDPPASMACKEPRPQMCAMIYEPVCGLAKDGGHKTYGNACSACANDVVVGYASGACKKD